MLVFGLIFGILAIFNWVLVIPSTMLLIMSGIHILEVSKKNRHILEEHVNFKLLAYEAKMDSAKKELELIKTELDSLKTRLSAAQSFGMKK